MKKIYVETKKLPAAIGAAIFIGELVNPRELGIVVADRGYASSGNQGERAWLVILPSIDSPDGIRSMRGAFGGPNPYEKHEIDQYSTAGIDVPEHGLILTGSGRHAVCYMRAATLARILEPDHPATLIAGDAATEGRSDAATAIASEALSDHASKKQQVSNAIRWTVWVFKGLKSSYRKDALRELAQKTASNAGTAEMIEECIKRGLLARKGSGIQITTEGKNVALEAPYRASAVTARDYQ